MILIFRSLHINEATWICCFWSPELTFWLAPYRPFRYICPCAYAVSSTWIYCAIDGVFRDSWTWTDEHGVDRPILWEFFTILILFSKPLWLWSLIYWMLHLPRILRDLVFDILALRLWPLSLYGSLKTGESSTLVLGLSSKERKLNLKRLSFVSFWKGRINLPTKFIITKLLWSWIYSVDWEREKIYDFFHLLRSLKENPNFVFIVNADLYV